MPVGTQELPGKVGNDKPQKCQRPDHSGGCCNVQCDPQQQPADAAVIIYAQIDGLIFAQCQNIQQRKLFPEGKGDQHQNRNGQYQNRRIDIGKAGDQIRQQRVVLVGVHHTGQGRLDAGKERGQHRADEQDVQNIVVRFPEQIAVDHGGNSAHNGEVYRKGSVGIDCQKAARTRHKEHRRVDQRIKLVHTQQAGRNDGVVDDGLKHDGGTSDGKGCNEHGDQLGRADAHGVGK